MFVSSVSIAGVDRWDTLNRSFTNLEKIADLRLSPVGLCIYLQEFIFETVCDGKDTY